MSHSASASSSLTVASFWIEYLLDAARRAGVEITPTLAPDERVSLNLERRLFEKAIRDSGDPLFGLHMGECIRPRFMGELGYASMSSATLRDAIELMIPFNRVTSEFTELRFEWRDDGLWLIWEPLFDDGDIGRHRLEALMGASVVFGRWILGAGYNPRAAHFRHRPPDHDASAEYRRLFGCPVHFQGRHNALVLAPSVLDLPLRDADPEVNRVARSRVQRAVSRYRARDDLLEKVRLEIQRRLTDGVAPQLEPIAERLDVKPWTLRRRLRAEQTDFSTLLEEQRRLLACDWLRHSDRSVNRIALDLGYSEQSAFNRAFKRWFGVTPLHYRDGDA